MKGRLVFVKMGNRRRTLIQIGVNPPALRGKVLYQIPEEADNIEELIRKLKKHKGKRGSRKKI